MSTLAPMPDKTLRALEPKVRWPDAQGELNSQSGDLYELAADKTDPNMPEPESAAVEQEATMDLRGAINFKGTCVEFMDDFEKFKFIVSTSELAHEEDSAYGEDCAE